MAGVFLTDFGLARQRAAPSASATGPAPSKLTHTGTTLGTPAYMSPEQARGDFAALTPASDVWGLGCVLYEALTGRPAFGGGTPAEVVARVLAGDPTPLRRVRADVPGAVEALVRATLARPPHRRPATSAALRDDLDRVRAGGRARARPPRRGGARLALGAVAGAGAVGGALWWGGRPVPASEAPSGEAESALAARLAAADPSAAARHLEAALRAAPARHDWRVQLGLLRWASRDLEGARAAFDAVPADAAEADDARVYRATMAYFEAQERGRRAEDPRPLIEAALRGTGRAGRLARVMVEMLRPERDLARVRALLADDAGWLGALLRANAEQLLAGGDLDVALREYDRACSEGLAFASVLNNRASALLQRGETARAAADLDRALALSPDYARAWSNRAALRLGTDDLDGALADAERALALEPDLAHALANRAHVRERRRDLVGARADLDRAVARLEDDGLPQDLARTLALRGRVRHLAGDRPGGAADLDRSLALLPEGPDARLWRGVARAEAGDHAGAVADFQAVLRWRPDDDEGLANLALSLLALGRVDEAGSAAERAVAVAPQRAHAWRARALVHFERGRYAEAVADLDAALAADPRDAAALGNRANARMHLDDLAGAVTDYDAALALAPDDPMLLANRATLHVMRGHPEEAERDAARALAAHPDHVVALAAGGLAARALGRWALAAERFQRFLEVASPHDRRRRSVQGWLAEVEARRR